MRIDMLHCTKAVGFVLGSFQDDCWQVFYGRRNMRFILTPFERRQKQLRFQMRY